MVYVVMERHWDTADVVAVAATKEMADQIVAEDPSNRDITIVNVVESLSETRKLEEQ
jgi:hypothetical protein